MATTFDSVKTNIPGVGYRAYIWAIYTASGGNCLPNQLNAAFQCTYLFGEGSYANSWQPQGPLNGLYPNVGEYVTIIQYAPAPSTVFSTFCYKVLAIVDEATFNTGVCLECYNNGYAGYCSDIFQYIPDDPAGCQYNNSINAAGIAAGSFSVPANLAAGITWDSWIQTDCSACIAGTPVNYDPNTVVNCCDPSETYTLEPPSLNWPVYNDLTVTLGIDNYTKAFRADFYIGGAQTGMKCWYLEKRTNTFGASVINVQVDPGTVFPDCSHLENWLMAQPNYDPCCYQFTGCPPTDPASPYNSPNPLVVLEFCTGCDNGSINHPDCVCCDPTGRTSTATGCTFPDGALIILQDKVDEWRTWRDMTFSSNNLNSTGNPLGSSGPGPILVKGTTRGGSTGEGRGKGRGNNGTEGPFGGGDTNTFDGFVGEEEEEAVDRERRREGGMSDIGDELIG